MELFCKLRENNILITQASSNDSRDFLMNILKKKYEQHAWSKSYEDNIKSLIRTFSVILVRKWRASNSTFNGFTKKNVLWLQKQFEMPNQCNKKIKQKVGRPKKLFTETSIRSKQRQSAVIGKICTTPEITFIAKSKLYKSGRRTLANLLEEGASTPKRALKMKKALKTKKVIPFSPQEALAFILDNKLTKQQYINIRCDAIKRNANIYPAYEHIKKAKQECYPENCVYTEQSCHVPLQDILNHTTKRIVSIIEILDNNECKDFEMLYKWGCDGSSNHSQYKQSFQTTDISDTSMFTVSLVPLQLQCMNNNEKIVLWSNPRYSSTRFCRPLKFIFMKENNDKTIEMYTEIEDEIARLTNTIIYINDISIISIKHTLIFSMIDGKVMLIYFINVAYF